VVTIKTLRLRLTVKHNFAKIQLAFVKVTGKSMGGTLLPILPQTGLSHWLVASFWRLP